ncbi:MAG: hypothetical protein R3286_04815 [Gammaproteobacteria bacterium]|nr:hypothetical protein [Gammaproteobacteria bacterium]
MSSIAHTMIGQPKSILAVLAVSVATLAAWLVLSDPDDSIRPQELDTSHLEGSAVLDGRTFASELGPAGQPADTADTLIFDNGMFLSVECYRTCNFPAQPYFVRRKDDGIEFISETRCPNKDAQIVWRGTVQGDTIEGEFTWTMSRWYWTIEKTFHFEGRLTDTPGSVPLG